MPMTRYSDAELEAMLATSESDLAERKESLGGHAPEDIREAICSFANDLPDHRRPGVVFVGARDNGTPSHVPITDQMLLQLADMKTDGNIVPPPTLTVEKRRLRGADMVVVTAEPSDSPPVRLRGRIQIRIGPRRGVASAQDERILTEKRRYRDRPFDLHPVAHSNISDLDRAFFEGTYLAAAVAPDVLAANQRSYEERLAATKMIVSAAEPVPTVLGLLVLGITTRDFLPGAYVQFLRLAGTTLADAVIDDQVIDGNLSALITRLEEKLTSHNRTAVNITGGAVEQRTPTFPMTALQQLVRNAILHRTYQDTNAPVRISWYSDRLEIISPGGPFGEVTIENFGRPGVTDYRNPNLAEALRSLGFIQRFGAGIPIARQAIEQNGNPPLQFHVEPTYVGITIRART